LSLKTTIFIFILTAWGTYLALTSPRVTETKQLATLTGDPENGAYVFIAAGCASCHMDKASNDRLFLSGGQAFVTQFGTFYAPNVSMSGTDGIGNWTLEHFAAALRDGINPDGQHYFPVFPYTDYAKMTDQDVVDLWAFWRSLPAVESANVAHEISFPFSMRRNIGLWKWLYADTPYVSQQGTRGAYLVEALGHCAQCHTPRDPFGGLDVSRWMTGAPSADGRANIPPIAPSELKWSAEEIAEYLQSGFTPEYDMVGGHMAAVVENTSRLTTADRNAIATYLTNLEN
jgi:mono/diheme cytochrome c family protein